MRRRAGSSLRLVLGLALAWTWVGPTAVFGVPFVIEYGDPPGSGFHDPVLGEARRTAFEYAVHRFEQTLAGTVPVVVHAEMTSLGGSGGSALLASAGPSTIHRDFPGAPTTGVFYPAALANQLTGFDLDDGRFPEMHITFNGDIDDNRVLGSVRWHYGTDAAPGMNIDFATIAMHELGHGLGFSNSFFVDVGRFFADAPSAFDLHIERPPFGSFPELREAERRSAAVSNSLLWNGAHALGQLGGGPLRLFAPPVYAPGSSIAHFDPERIELMAPSFQGANHELGALLGVLLDIGWQLTPDVSPIATAPPTATPTATATPTMTPPLPLRPETVVLAAHFDDNSVSLIDHARAHVVARLSVPDGPRSIGVDPVTGNALVASFRAGSLSVIDPRRRRVAATIHTGGAPRGIAVDGPARRAFVTDTETDSILTIDLDAHAVVGSIAVGEQPTAIAITPAGNQVLVTHFSQRRILAIDTAIGQVRGDVRILGNSRDVGMREIVLDASGDNAFVAAVRSNEVTRVSLATLATGPPLFYPGRLGETPTGLVIDAASGELRVTASDPNNTIGRIYVLDLQSREWGRTAITTARSPVAIASTSDGSEQYLGFEDLPEVHVYAAQGRSVLRRIAVPHPATAVAALAVSRICAGDCDADERTTVDEIVTAVQVALGQKSIEGCRTADRDGSGTVTVEEVVLAVQAALTGC